MRTPDWSDRLWQNVREFNDVPFRWGKNDCCLFAAKCIDDMTGSGWVQYLNDRYWDEHSAKDYIVMQGGIEAAVSYLLGPPVSRLQARRGDVCMVETPEGYGIAVCLGGTCAIPSATGLVVKPMHEAIKAWRVG